MGKTYEGISTRWKYILKTVSIIGPNGQFGSDLVKIFTTANWKVIAVTHDEVSVENADSVLSALKSSGADWVINTAAFHKVDECEKDPQRAWEINAHGAKNVAIAARDLGMRTVFISSDYVYSGNKADSYSESDPVSPVNVYGHSKAAGEAITLAASDKNLVVRVASVFGSAGSSGKGSNFVETIINKAKSGDPLSVVDDMEMSPTYTVDAALNILGLLNHDLYGIFHATNSGSITWFGFAQEILKQTKLVTELSPSKTNLDSLVKRPMNSKLDTNKIKNLIINLPNWSDGLNRYLVEKGHIK